MEAAEMSLRDVINTVGLGRWGFPVQRQTVGLGQVVHPDRHPHEDRLRALESGGGSTTVVARALMDGYHQGFPLFHGLSSGFRRRDQIHATNPEMACWALTVFKNPWRVLDELGTRPKDLVGYLLARWQPGLWMDDASGLLRLPEHICAVLREDCLEFGPQDTGLDLAWLPNRLACGLTVQGPIPRVRLPEALACRGPVILGQLGTLRTIEGITATGHSISVSACPDLIEVRQPVDATRVEVRDCTSLTRIIGRLQADLTVEDCPSLEEVLVTFPREPPLPAPKVTIRRCLRLQSIGKPSSVGRVCGDLTLEDCPELSYLQALLTIRGHKAVTNCPALGPVKGGW